MPYYVYIVASKSRGTLYIGVTNDLLRRVFQHKAGIVEGFTEKHGVTQLVYYEVFEDVEKAIEREKRLKKWKRSWKIKLIEERNLYWEDLFERLCG